MTIYKFPSDNGRRKDPKKEKETHHPEFIDIEDLQFDETLKEDESAEYYTPPPKFERYQLPFLLKLFIFIIGMFLFSWFLLLCFLTLIFASFSLITLGIIPSINQKVVRAWSLAKKMFAIGLGLTITSFSPNLGMGFLSLYFTLKGNRNEGLFERFFKNVY